MKMNFYIRVSCSFDNLKIFSDFLKKFFYLFKRQNTFGKWYTISVGYVVDYQ